MEILRFTLSGKSAFFKKPEVNSYVYYTYGNIHKVALLGLFGALLGYGGYAQLRGFEKEKKSADLTQSYPEFYEKLKDLKISVLPVHEKGFIHKKIQAFNNSIGYASKELGGNLITKEQWLENPKWEICLLVDSEEAEKVKAAICSRRCVFYPYLGKNDHPATIEDIEVEVAKEIAFEQGRLDCLAQKEHVKIADLDYDEQMEQNAFSEFKYQEALPCEIDEWLNHYILKTFLYTDAFVEVSDTTVYELRDGKKIMFH
ncbi:MAG: type I-B CRISPR-associated protein Cas5b [Lachnospiraceae bacterium]|nr:type I-B CRISPR-associated protein Cas5b [Lachnospiraceae bacterium]